jgi:hypothetical protein
MRGRRIEETTRRPGAWGGRRNASLSLLALALAGLLLGIATRIDAGGEQRATRAELQAGRRRAASLESEVALSATRKVYIVLDLEARSLRYRLMGMTMREIPVEAVEADGLVGATEVDGNAKHFAGIFTLREKEGDPRLDPLTPEQVEAGADDENVAAVFPPEPPKAYRLDFKQPIAIRVSGKQEGTGVKGVAYRLKKALGGLFGGGATGGTAVRIDLHLEPDAATEFWRSVIPDQRWLILPPPGLALPDAGQEAPPKPKGPRPAPPVTAKVPKPPGPEEIPFRIPPPEEPQGAGGDTDSEPAPKPAERLDQPQPKKPPAPPETPPAPPGDEPPAEPEDPGKGTDR